MNAHLSSGKTGKNTALYNSALVATKMKTTPKLNIMLNNTQSEQSFNNVTIKTQDRHNSVSNHLQQPSGLFLKIQEPISAKNSSKKHITFSKDQISDSQII